MIAKGQLFMRKWYPKDVIALVSITGCIVMMCLGYNHVLPPIFAALTGAYIGVDIKLNRNKP